MLNSKRHTGFSLVELLITMGLSLVLLLGIYKVYSSFVDAGFENLRHGNLTHELHSTMNTMSRELRRATTEVSYNEFDWDTDMDLQLTDDEGNIMVITPGDPVSFPVVNEGDVGPILGAGPAFGNGRVQLTLYNGNGASAQGVVLTAFQNLPENGRLLPGEWFVVDSNVKAYGDNTRVLSSGNCILFSYDKNKNLEIENEANINEQFGFKITTTNGVGKVQKRSGGDFTDCSTGTWVDVTNDKVINISSLNFVVADTNATNGNGDTLSRKQVTISLTGQLIADATLSKSLTNTVQVRNEQYTVS